MKNQALMSTCARHDMDGDGLSDIVLQNSCEGREVVFWKNGIAESSGTGQFHSEDWRPIGAYDMDEDGKADLLFIGAIESQGANMLSLGYYTQGIDTSENWHSIGNLLNTEKIDWKLAVGNLSGRPNANSIAWQAPSLGALGIWCDGSSQWLGITGYFDQAWQMLGCGDFLGSGRDGILFSFNGGEAYYSVDIDGNLTRLCELDAGWQCAAIGDFEACGQDQLIFSHKKTGLVKLWKHLKETTTRSKQPRWKFEKPTPWTKLGQLDLRDWLIVGAGHYASTRQDDLLIRQKSTGMLGYFTGADLSSWHAIGTLPRKFHIIQG